MSPDNITVLAPCFYPTTSPVHRLVTSAKRFGIPLRLYGLGEPFKGWVHSHVTRLMSELKTCHTSHFLFTDAVDCVFLADLEEITAKYEAMDSPPLLVSEEKSGLNAGGFMGEIQWMLECLEKVSRLDDGDPQVRWRQLRMPLMRDSLRAIFQTTSDQARLEVEFGRVNNRLTEEQPCVLHCCGGYTDPLVHKSALLDPWWQQLEVQWSALGK